MNTAVLLRSAQNRRRPILLRVRNDNLKMTSRTATLIGLTAIIMWSLLAVMTVATGRIPAFQLAAMTFAIGGLAGCASWLFRPKGFSTL